MAVTVVICYINKYNSNSHTVSLCSKVATELYTVLAILINIMHKFL